MSAIVEVSSTNSAVDGAYPLGLYPMNFISLFMFSYNYVSLNMLSPAVLFNE